MIDRIAGFLVISFLLSLILISCSGGISANNSIVVYCGAGLNKAASEIGEKFEEKYGIPVHYNFAGSHTLLAQMQLLKSGDVYIPGSAYYLEIAAQKGVVETSKTIAYHIPVIAVPAGNPKGIASLEDLGKKNVRIGLGDAKAAAIGKTAVDILEKNRLFSMVQKNVVTRTATVNELVAFLGLRQLDAAIVWEDNAVAAPGKIQIVPIPESRNRIKTIPAGILTFSSRKDRARLFVEFLRSDAAKGVFKKYGFKPYTEDSNPNHKRSKPDG